MINGYVADFIELGMNIGEHFGEQITKFAYFLLRIKDPHVREIFLEIGRPLFSEWGSCWLINLAPDTSFFVKFLTDLRIEWKGAYSAVALEAEKLTRFKEELSKVNDFSNVKKRLLTAFPHYQQQIELFLKEMGHNGGFKGVGWTSRDYSLILYDAGIRYYVGKDVTNKKTDCNAVALIVSGNDEDYLSSAEYIYNNYAQDILNALQLEVDLPRGKSARPLDQFKAKAIEENSIEMNLPRSFEQRIRLAELLCILKRREEAESELKKATAEKPEMESEEALMDKILTKLGFVGSAQRTQETESSKMLIQSSARAPDLLSEDLEQTKHAPIINVNTPTANSVYLAKSALQLKFTVTDCVGLEPNVNAVLTNWLGSSTVVSSGSPLPSQSGLYKLLISATDNVGRNTTLSIPFVIHDPNIGKVHGHGTVKFPQEVDITPEGANFGFSVKYDKGSISSDSYIDYQPFNIKYPWLVKGDLKSTKIDWLVISGNTAIFQGIGIINKQSKNNFRVQVPDCYPSGNQPGNFQITIWNTPSIEISPTSYKGNLTKGKIEVKRN
ncbi:hypothetical protein MUP77_21575 [Candidatus Bathyarchaeota archaeon]|nr:hypothetical protein [Candidatus Bathyarchaeota archaeon]